MTGFPCQSAGAEPHLPGTRTVAEAAQIIRPELTVGTELVGSDTNSS